MEYCVQFSRQVVVEESNWTDAQLLAARELIEAVRKAGEEMPVGALLDLGFSIGVSRNPDAADG